MIDAVQILWSPSGVTLSALDPLELVDVTDGETANIRMPVRMLSVDTSEVTARTGQRAKAIDQEFAQLAEWIGQGRAPISRPLAKVLLPKLATGRAGSLQLQQGRDASAFAKQRFQECLTRPDGSKRKLFIRMADSPFDDNGRLLAYVAPNYTEKERRTLTRAQRATFNLDLVEAGHAAPLSSTPRSPANSTCRCCWRRPAPPLGRRGGSGRTPRPCWPMSTAPPRSCSRSPARWSTTSR
jgi:hypothetical protein